MKDVLYIQTDKNVKVISEQVYLQDIARLSASSSKVLDQCSILLVITLPEKEYGRYTASAIDLVKQVQQRFEHVHVVHIGEPEFILTYENPGKKNAVLGWLKTLSVCLITFFGTMFSIMTFNTDVDVPRLFQGIYFQFTGQVSDGFTILEMTYSLGIGIGVVFFFNHFGKWKLSYDPTPMEVEMRTYENEVDDTILEMKNREES